MAVVGTWSAPGCAINVDRSEAHLRLAFAECITDGGGHVGQDFQLAVVGGEAVATVGPGVDASDALHGRCLELVNR
jgi:hypothetical protein